MGQGDEDGLTCTKKPKSFHRDVEQVVFSPSSMVPGIEDSPDPLLQFRIFFYCDAQYHHVDANLRQAPVYCPCMAKSHASLNFDGAMRTDANHASNKQYAPNMLAATHLTREHRGKVLRREAAGPLSAKFHKDHGSQASSRYHQGITFSFICPHSKQKPC